MSREGAPSKQPKTERPAGTPIWVWVVYSLGILGASIFVLSVLFTLYVVYGSDSGDSFNGAISLLGLVVWGVPIVAAALLWTWRRYRL